MLKKLWGRPVEFLTEVKGELKKVSYPTRSETIGSTSVVLVFCVIMSLYLSVVDSILVWIVAQVL
ncbi:MAG: preprotein translocase subunit SecE [Nitrospirales bacterium]